MHSPTDQYYLDPVDINIKDLQNNSLGTFDKDSIKQYMIDNIPADDPSTVVKYIKSSDEYISASTTVIEDEVSANPYIFIEELFKGRSQQIIDIISDACMDFLNKNYALNEFVKYTLLAIDNFGIKNIVDIDIKYLEDPDIPNNAWINLDISLKEESGNILKQYDKFIDKMIEKIDSEKNELFTFSFTICE